jgi:hypothetical protein
MIGTKINVFVLICQFIFPIYILHFTFIILIMPVATHGHCASYTNACLSVCSTAKFSSKIDGSDVDVNLHASFLLSSLQSDCNHHVE